MEQARFFDLQIHTIKDGIMLIFQHFVGYLSYVNIWSDEWPCTANQNYPYTSRTLANGQSVREGYGRFEECKDGLRDILYIV
jgi:hypothetical protein